MVTGYRIIKTTTRRPKSSLKNYCGKGRHGKFYSLLGTELDQLEEMFLSHFSTKGTSWKCMNLNKLRFRIDDELAEYDRISDYEKMIKELSDTALFVIFLMNNINRRIKNNKIAEEKFQQLTKHREVIE